MARWAGDRASVGYGAADSRVEGKRGAGEFVRPTNRNTAAKLFYWNRRVAPRRVSAGGGVREHLKPATQEHLKTGHFG